MNNSSHFLPTTRREFLQRSGRGIGLLAFSQFAPSFLVESTLAATPAPEKDRPILVLVQLAGGNDGLNTVVPFEDAAYYRLRPTLGVAKGDVLRLNPELPLEMKRLDMRIRYRGHSLDLRLTRDALRIRERDGVAQPISLCVDGKVCEFVSGSTRVFRLDNAAAGDAVVE